MNKLIYLLICGFFFSCRQKAANEETVAAFRQLNDRSSFSRYISANYDPEERARFEKGLGLDSLLNGVDSVAIRFRLGCWLTGQYMVDLKNHKGNWTGRVGRILWPENAGEEGKSDAVTPCCYFRKVKPASGWEEFIKKLIQLKLTALPGLEEIPGLKKAKPNDGCYIISETATRNSYRYINYTNHDFYTDTCWQAANMDSIWKLLESELSFSTSRLIRWPRYKEPPDSNVIIWEEVIKESK